MRSKGFLGLVFLAIVIFMAGCSGCGSYNNLVSLDEEVTQSWGNVENVYQRRADLIPSLVETVKGATEFEMGQMESMKELEQLLGTAKNSGQGGDDFFNTQNRIGDILNDVFSTRRVEGGESASESFRDLQVQIEGANNRISTERRRYNEKVSEYNEKIRRFPTSIVAMITGFGEREVFEASDGAKTAPKVDL